MPDDADAVLETAERIAVRLDSLEDKLTKRPNGNGSRHHVAVPLWLMLGIVLPILVSALLVLGSVVSDVQVIKSNRFTRADAITFQREFTADLLRDHARAVSHPETERRIAELERRLQRLEEGRAP